MNAQERKLDSLVNKYDLLTLELERSQSMNISTSSLSLQVQEAKSKVENMLIELSQELQENYDPKLKMKLDKVRSKLDGNQSPYRDTTLGNRPSSLGLLQLEATSTDMLLETPVSLAADLPSPTFPTQQNDIYQNLSSQQLLKLQVNTLEEQDRNLDILQQSVSRQRELGEAIGFELDIHNNLLDETESGLDQTQNRIDTADRRLKKVISTMNYNKMYWIISSLFLVFLFVLMMGRLFS